MMMATLAAIGATTPGASLFVDQIADPNVLREAWYRVQRGGKAPGVDGVTIDAFRPYAERRLQELGHALVVDRYQPSPVKRVQIPKATGGWRVLGMPTIADRIVQTAAALVLHDRVTALFSDRSFAYRPFLGPRRAAVFLRTRLDSVAWVVTADIEKFFDNVEHVILADHLRNAGIDDAAIRLILKWLKAPAQDRGRLYQPVKGLPQGSPIAPVLANLYLTGFDTALEAEGFTHVRYADDFVLLAPDETEAQRALGYVSTYLTSRLRLRIKPAKTQLARADDGFTFVGFRFTRDTWTVPRESIERFKETITTLLSDADSRRTPDVAKSHNDLVRGWRHYYFGNAAEMDRQLGELDVWRAAECDAYLARVGGDPGAAVVWFERLAEHPDSPAPAGSYGLPPESSETDADTLVDAVDQWRHGPRDERERPRGSRMFATSRELHEAEIGRKQLPVLLDGGWLRVPTYGGFVTKSHALVIVRRKKQVIFECAFDDVSCLTLEADGVVLSTTVIEECARRRIPVAVCRVSGKPIARIVSARSPLDPPVVRRQLAAHAGRSGTALMQSIIAAKLGNQRALLLYHSKYQRRAAETRRQLVAAAEAIETYASRIHDYSTLPLRTARRPLFLAEARAAAHYWQAFAVLVPGRLGFHQRVHRTAADVVNKALNYGYAQLLGRVWVAVHRAGLEASLGLLHTGRHRSAGLVFDLMEPFRQPIVDRAVLGLIGRAARLELNEKGNLTLRTRALLQRAIARRLDGPSRGTAQTLRTEIERQVVAFRHALIDGRPYRPYRMTW